MFGCLIDRGLLNCVCVIVAVAVVAVAAVAAVAVLLLLVDWFVSSPVISYSLFHCLFVCVLD